MLTGSEVSNNTGPHNKLHIPHGAATRPCAQACWLLCACAKGTIVCAQRTNVYQHEIGGDYWTRRRLCCSQMTEAAAMHAGLHGPHREGSS